MSYSLGFSLLLLICLMTAGCSKIPIQDDGVVSYTVAERINSQVEWRQGCHQDQVIQRFISSSILKELTVDTAIQIALLNNPKVQATFEDIGIARADLVEAGLLSNPSFEIEVRYPHIIGLKTNIEYLITSSILDIFLMPLRIKLASSEFEQAKLRVSNEVLNLAFEVRETYYELFFEIKKIKYLQSSVELSSIHTEISSRQIAVGNINTLDFQLSQARFLEAELDLSRAQSEVIHLKEKLNRLLGFSNDVCLILPEDLLEVDYFGVDLCTLESIALEKRLDLQISRLEIIKLSQMLGLKDWWTYTNFKAGLAGERDPDGTNLMGPGFSGDLPIFNYGQAARMRLYSKLRQAQNNLAELEIRILAEVREAHKLLMSNLKIINKYRDSLLIMQGNISTSSEKLYNVMGLGIDKLLENKRQEIIATQNYSESLKRFLVARVQLDKALGGHLFKLLIENQCIDESY